MVTHLMAAVGRTRRIKPSWSIHLASGTRSGNRDTARWLVGVADFAGGGPIAPLADVTAVLGSIDIVLRDVHREAPTSKCELSTYVIASSR